MTIIYLYGIIIFKYFDYFIDVDISIHGLSKYMETSNSLNISVS